MHTSPSLEFNARFLPASQIASNFVQPDQFDDVLSMAHNIIIGPRGSGKTTILKMLTLGALEKWNQVGAETVIRSISYNAAFIPSDHVWSQQLAMASMGEAARGESHDWGRTAFFVHTVMALISAIAAAAKLGRNNPPNHLQHLAVDLNGAKEEEFVRLIARSLNLEVPTTKFLGLEIALRRLLRSIDGFRYNQGENSCRLFSTPGDFFNSLSLILDVINGLIDQPDRRWALLFDEIEIAPKSIFDILFSSLRSFDQRFIIKLALWPYMRPLHRLSFDVGTSTRPTADNDFKVVSLTYSHKGDTDAFSSAFTEHVFQRIGVERSEFPQIFGTSIFEKGQGRYSAAQRLAQSTPDLFAQLETKDPSFRQYLNEKGLKHRTTKLSESESAALVRKAMPVAIMRNFYLHSFEKALAQSAKRRSRKSPAVYTGFPSIIQIADGNPRTLLLLLAPLVRSLEAMKEANAHARIPQSVQNEAIDGATGHMRALLLATPVALPRSMGEEGLLGLIDEIGGCFSTRLLGDRFDPDYVGSFVVDKNTPEVVEHAIGEALNAGAIVYVPYPDSNNDSIIEGVKEKRFRISYALSPRYKLPLILGRSISLTSLLAEANQKELFDEI